MADPGLWRAWEARSDLEATAIDALAVTLPDATADDLIVVLGPHVLQLSGPAPTRTVDRWREW